GRAERPGHLEAPRRLVLLPPALLPPGAPELLHHHLDRPLRSGEAGEIEVVPPPVEGLHRGGRVGQARDLAGEIIASQPVAGRAHAGETRNREGLAVLPVLLQTIRYLASQDRALDLQDVEPLVVELRVALQEDLDPERALELIQDRPLLLLE